MPDHENVNALLRQHYGEVARHADRAQVCARVR